MSEIDLILTDLGEIYRNAHDIATRAHHPLAHKILNDCNELARQYRALKENELAIGSTPMGTFKVEPCDVFLHAIEGDSLFSKIERWAVGNFNHVSMFVGEAFGEVPFLVESDGRGAVIQSLQHKTGQLVLVMRPEVAAVEKKILISEAIKLASDDNAYYDYFTIVRSCIPRVLWEKFPFLPIPPEYIRDQMMICSEAIAEIFWRSGFDILPKDIVPLPSDFEKSLLLTPVARGRIMEDILP